jgi:hypothetical protein
MFCTALCIYVVESNLTLNRHADSRLCNTYCNIKDMCIFYGVCKCRVLREKVCLFSKIVKRPVFDDANAVCLLCGRKFNLMKVEFIKVNGCTLLVPRQSGYSYLSRCAVTRLHVRGAMRSVSIGGKGRELLPFPNILDRLWAPFSHLFSR